MISYAQNGEDVVLNRVFGDQTRGFYVDIGAADPVSHSVTKHFYDAGWHGINIEPVKSFFALLTEARPRDVNLCVGVSSEEGELTLWEGPDGYGGSTFMTEVAESEAEDGIKFERRAVPVTTLTRIFEEHVSEEIDFLKIDVEGLEREVLESADFQRWRPRIVVVEATVPHTNIPNHEKWDKLLLSNDYCFALFDGINRFFVRAEDRHLVELLSAPVNCLDDYVPFEHKQRVEELAASAESARVALHASDDAFRQERSALEHTLRLAQEELLAVRTRADVAIHALAETRQQLISSQMAAADSQLRLIATQAALLDSDAALATARHEAERQSTSPPPRPVRLPILGAGKRAIRSTLRRRTEPRR